MEPRTGRGRFGVQSIRHLEGDPMTVSTALLRSFEELSRQDVAVNRARRLVAAAERRVLLDAAWES
jgi:hypothetical protein